MTEPDDDRQQQQHWDELAKQLGLPTGQEESPKIQETPKSKPVESYPIPPVQAPPIVRVAERESPEPLFEPKRQPSVGAETEEPLVETAAAEPALEHEAADGQKPAPEDDRPEPRGRRRRRRSSKAAPSGEARESEAPEPPGPARDAEPEEIDPDAPRGRSRRGGRGRSKSAPRAERSPVKDVVKPELVAAPHPDPEDDTDDMSGWTVPSWNDLIESLYRPDR